MRYLWLPILLFVLAVSSSAQTLESTKYFTKTFQDPVSYMGMQIIRNGNQISGGVSRDGGVPDTTIKGTISNTGVVTIYEYDVSGKLSIIWKGRFYGTDRFSGMVRLPREKVGSKFTLNLLKE